MLTAYFDESNTSPNQKTPIVAGYLASTFQWKRFGEQWGKLLLRHDVPIDPRYGQRIAHRSKMHPKNKLLGAWVPDHLHTFLEQAHPMIRRHIRIPIGNAVFRSEYNQLVPPLLRQTIGDAYGWCIYSSLYTQRQWCIQNKHDEPINWVFEEGALERGRVCEWFNKMRKNEHMQKSFRMGTLSFGNKTLKPLQAADLLANALGKFALDSHLGRTRDDVNNELRSLLGPTPPKGGKVIFWDRPALESMMKKMDEAGLLPPK